jgi:hypothetical protein
MPILQVRKFRQRNSEELVQGNTAELGFELGQSGSSEYVLNYYVQPAKQTSLTLSSKATRMDSHFKVSKDDVLHVNLCH